MPWIISNGKSYVEIIGNNQMITTAYIDRAHTFNNKKTAEKYCSLLPKAMKNLKYKVMFKQLRQQQAQACWAINTGCPRIGVCLPSFGMIAGASRIRMKSAA